jgi:hypothetical protein
MVSAKALIRVEKIMLNAEIRIMVQARVRLAREQKAKIKSPPLRFAQFWLTGLMQHVAISFCWWFDSGQSY